MEGGLASVARGSVAAGSVATATATVAAAAVLLAAEAAAAAFSPAFPAEYFHARAWAVAAVAAAAAQGRRAAGALQRQAAPWQRRPSRRKGNLREWTAGRLAMHGTSVATRTHIRRIPPSGQIMVVDPAVGTDMLPRPHHHLRRRRHIHNGRRPRIGQWHPYGDGEAVDDTAE